VVYRHVPIEMWPPLFLSCACSKRLHYILNLSLLGPAHSRSITGILNECWFIYIVRSGRLDNALGVIVMINFNRSALALNPNDTGSRNEEERVEGQFDTLRWTWTPGACRRGTCQ
jgi:hypothetical protein